MDDPHQITTRMHTWAGLMHPQTGTLVRMGPMMQLAPAARTPPLRPQPALEGGGACGSSATLSPATCAAILAACIILAMVLLVVFFGFMSKPRAASLGRHSP